MMLDGIEQALADADLALTELSPESIWRPTAHLSRGIAAALLGATAHATDELTATIELGRAAGAVEEVYLAHAQLALLAARRGAWSDARSQAQAAAVLVEGAGLGDYSTSAITHAATARVAVHEATTPGRAVRRWPAPTVCARCSTRAFPG